jgi:hypothetical protein
MKAIVLISIVLLVFQVNACAEEVWLQPAPISFWGTKWQRVPASSYLDLGDDPAAVKALKNAKFMVDAGVSEKSLALKCQSPNKRYLVRSFYLDNLNAIVYQTANGLIVNSGSFSEPRNPSPGAVAICLSHDPIDVRGGVSFAK